MSELDDALDLFHQPVSPPSTPVDTSEDAAASMEDVAATVRWAVLEAICRSPAGLTTEEIELQLKLDHQTVSPRVWEMARKMKVPLVEYSAATRINKSKRKAHVVVPTDAGRRTFLANADAGELP